MKYIKKTIYCNKVIMLITLILYVTFFLGLYVQVILGFSQVLTGIFLLFFIKKFSKENQTRLKYYWGFVLSYGFLWLIDLLNFHEGLWVVSLIILPLSIASYFTFILEYIKKEI